MAELENLQIIIDVIDEFEEELDRLLFKLGEVETASQAVDPVKIDVEVRGEHELDTLIAQLAMLEGMDTGGVGDIVLGEKSVRRGGGGGTARLGRGTKESIEGLVDSVDELAEGLGESLSDLSDNSDTAGMNMHNMARAAKSAEEGFQITNLRMSDLHNAMARLVPLILVFIGAIPALIGALVSLAAAAVAATAALGAIAGFGALGAAMARGDTIGEGFEDIMSEIRDDFLDAFAPMARRLEPLFEDGLDGLQRLFQEIANEGDVLIDFADKARDAGQWLIETVPSFMQDFGNFAEAAADALGLLINMTGSVDWFRAMAGFIAQTLPPLIDFGRLLGSLIPVLLRVSIGFLEATNGILAMMNTMGVLLNLLPISEEAFGLLVGSMLAALSVSLILNSALVSLAAKGLMSVGTAVLGAIQAFTGLSVAQTIAALSSYKLAAALTALAGAIALTGVGALLVLFGGIASSALTASSGIDQATKSLKEFQRQQRSMNTGNNPYANPDVAEGSVSGSSRFSGGDVNITVEGDADEESVRNQTQNALYRMERPRRKL